MMTFRAGAALCATLLLLPTNALAQLAPRATMMTTDRFLRGVPANEPVGPPFALSLGDAVKRGLEHNLGVLLEEQEMRSAESARWRHLSGLLPDVHAILRDSQQKVNLAAFGFTGFPGVPPIIGPFNVFDVRLGVSQPIFDWSAVQQAHEGTATVRAAEHAYQDARNLVVLVVANLYLQTLAAESRIEAAQAQLKAAESLYQLAADQKASGLVAGIDVLRADVERKAAQQRGIVAENDRARARLQLARAIGLPAAQEFTLPDRMTYTPVAALDVTAAMALALGKREDVLRAQSRVDAATAAVQSARADRLPSVHLQADYGQIGATVGTAAPTYSVSANVHVPIFDKGRTLALVHEREAELAERKAELADLQNGVSYDVQLALRDVSAAAEQVEVAKSGADLAAQALAQAQDRFRAGVASNIEVVQAQQAEAAARESHIASLYAHNVAKAALARAIGLGEQDFAGFLGGQAGWQKP
jgi:outer membrane protein TolC